MKKFSLIFALLFALPSLASENPVWKLQSEGKDPNFLFEADKKAMASVVQIVFRSGSLQDPKGKEGLVEIALNTLLRGTKDKSRQEFIGALEQLGASVEVETASTRTILTLHAISEKLPPALAFVAEALTAPGLREEEFQALKKEVLSQLHQEKSNNRALARRALRQTLYRGTPLAFPPEGTPESVEKITLNDVKDFLKTAIVRSNILFAVASNQKERDVKQWLTQSFAAVPDGPMPKNPPLELVPPKGRTLVRVDRPGSSTTEILLGHQGYAAPEKNRIILETGMLVFGSDFTSRLSRVLRGENGWTYGAYGHYRMLENPRRFGGTFAIYTFPQKEFTEKALLKALDLYADYVNTPVSTQELSDAKNSLSNSYPFALATADARLQSRLYEVLEGSKFYSVAEYRSLVRAVSPKRLTAAVRKIHDPENLVIVMVGDPSATKDIKIPRLTETKIISDPMSAF